MKKKAPGEVTVADMIGVMEELAPTDLAEEWDNCGLQVGSRLWPVQRVWVALDPLPSVVQEAVRQKIDMLITHHPLIFHPLRSIDLQTAVGKTIETAMGARLAIYAAHTNLDSTRSGVNDILARNIGLQDLSPMVPAPGAAGEAPLGIGRLGRLAQPLTLGALADRIKKRLHPTVVKVAGGHDLMVAHVAVCSGSGAGLMDVFLDSPAQVYISGDLRYHDARTAEENGRALIDIGHFPSEHLIIGPLADRLREIGGQRGWRIMVEPCPLERDPYAVW